MMKSVLVLFLCLLPTIACAREAAVSAFYTVQEVQDIKRAFRKEYPALLAQSRHILNCGSIVYLSPDEWSVWLQGEKWTPETDRPTLHIIEVTEDSVRVSIQPPDRAEPLDVTLQPHQSVNLLTGEVIEGAY